MTREEGESYVGKIFENKSRWSKYYKPFVKIIAYDHPNQKFYARDVNEGRVEWVDVMGNGEWFECGGIWLKIDLADPVIS